MRALSEKHLKLEVLDSGDASTLRFTSKLLGFKHQVAKIKLWDSAELDIGDLNRWPTWYLRWIYRISHGIRNFEQVLAISNSIESGDSIRFYEGSDRRGRTRILADVCISGRDGGEGEAFLTCPHDFDIIREQISKIREAGTVEQSVPAKSDRAGG